jgi:hypothetical protein
VSSRYVVFSHGKDSGPWGKKIAALADVARSEGYQAESVDYRGLEGPRERIGRLVDFCKELQGDLVLVGSSMDGLPPLREGLLDCPATIVHGWYDDVVPFDHSVRFAKSYGAALHLLRGDHQLHNQLRVIQYLFEYFLIALDLPARAFE